MEWPPSHRLQTRISRLIEWIKKGQSQKAAQEKKAAQQKASEELHKRQMELNRVRTVPSAPPPPPFKPVEPVLNHFNGDFPSNLIPVAGSELPRILSLVLNLTEEARQKFFDLAHQSRTTSVSLVTIAQRCRDILNQACQARPMIESFVNEIQKLMSSLGVFRFDAQYTCLSAGVLDCENALETLKFIEEECNNTVNNPDYIIRSIAKAVHQQRQHNPGQPNTALPQSLQADFKHNAAAIRQSEAFQRTYQRFSQAAASGVPHINLSTGAAEALQLLSATIESMQASKENQNPVPEQAAQAKPSLGPPILPRIGASLPPSASPTIPSR